MNNLKIVKLNGEYLLVNQLNDEVLFKSTFLPEVELQKRQIEDTSLRFALYADDVLIGLFKEKEFAEMYMHGQCEEFNDNDLQPKVWKIIEVENQYEIIPEGVKVEAYFKDDELLAVSRVSGEYVNFGYLCHIYSGLTENDLDGIEGELTKVIKF